MWLVSKFKKMQSADRKREIAHVKELADNLYFSYLGNMLELIRQKKYIMETSSSTSIL